MTKTSVDVDRELARRAADILGTRTLRDTIHASMHEIVQSRRRLELIDMLREEGRLDPDAAEHAWGGNE